jgi:hypothetical protein
MTNSPALNELAALSISWSGIAVTAAVSIAVSFITAWLIFEFVKKREMAEGGAPAKGKGEKRSNPPGSASLGESNTRIGPGPSRKT